jgi:hypothetical protein
MLALIFLSVCFESDMVLKSEVLLIKKNFYLVDCRQPTIYTKDMRLGNFGDDDTMIQYHMRYTISF